MAKNLQEIIAALPDAKVQGNANQQIEAIVFDSRKAAPCTLFVAQKGVSSDEIGRAHV